MRRFISRYYESSSNTKIARGFGMGRMYQLMTKKNPTGDPMDPNSGDPDEDITWAVVTAFKDELQWGTKDPLSGQYVTEPRRPSGGENRRRNEFLRRYIRSLYPGGGPAEMGGQWMGGAEVRNEEGQKVEELSAYDESDVERMKEVHREDVEMGRKGDKRRLVTHFFRERPFFIMNPDEWAIRALAQHFNQEGYIIGKNGYYWIKSAEDGSVWQEGWVDVDFHHLVDEEERELTPNQSIPAGSRGGGAFTFKPPEQQQGGQQHIPSPLEVSEEASPRSRGYAA